MRAEEYPASQCHASTEYEVKSVYWCFRNQPELVNVT